MDTLLDRLKNGFNDLLSGSPWTSLDYFIVVWFVVTTMGSISWFISLFVVAIGFPVYLIFQTSAMITFVLMLLRRKNARR
jgi:hypothetical protein